MKLLTKTSLFFLTISLFVLFIGGIVFYFSFRYMINREVKRELFSEMHEIILNPPKSIALGNDSVIFDLPLHYQIIPIREITKPLFVFGDTLLLDKILGRYQLHRQISYETELAGKPVRITISKSLLLTDELVEYVTFVTLGLTLVMLLFIIGFNNYFFSRIWGNFFKTIEVIKDYNISDTKGIKFTESEITEFNQLNHVFEKMHERIRQDYQNLKEFIENISHEIQTPLAIIKSKIDLLQQSASTDKNQAEMIQSIQGSAIRLSNLNKSLILLSRIDNKLFPAKEEVKIEDIINLHLDNFEDIIKSKNISLGKEIINPIVIVADPSLISILLLNLLKNAIYHNLPSGVLEIKMESNILVIRNTGKELDLNHPDIFKRFIKSSNRPDSLGLGLAIVKKICDYYNFKILYSYEQKFHILTINFN